MSNSHSRAAAAAWPSSGQLHGKIDDETDRSDLHETRVRSPTALPAADRRRGGRGECQTNCSPVLRKLRGWLVQRIADVAGEAERWVTMRVTSTSKKRQPASEG